MAAPTLVSSVTVATANDTTSSITGTPPSGAGAGHYLFAFIAHSDPTAPTAPPAGRRRPATTA
jgi:hypothetical protein